MRARRAKSTRPRRIRACAPSSASSTAAGVIRSETAPGHASSIITNADMTSVSATSAGFGAASSCGRARPPRRAARLYHQPLRRLGARGAQSPGHGHALLHAGRPFITEQPGLSGAGGSVSHDKKRLPVSPARLLSIAMPVTLQNLLASSFTLIDTMMIGRLAIRRWPPSAWRANGRGS